MTDPLFPLIANSFTLGKIWLAISKMPLQILQILKINYYENA